MMHQRVEATQSKAAMPDGNVRGGAADAARALRDAFGRFATGVTVVTATTPQGPVAITANSFSSVSLDPPLVLWSLGRHSRRFSAFADCGHYAIHVLAADQAELCFRFSKSGTDFADLDLALNRHGVPLLPRALARFECTLAERFEAGDHMILLGRVTEMATEDGQPLLFSGGRYASVQGAG